MFDSLKKNKSFMPTTEIGVMSGRLRRVTNLRGDKYRRIYLVCAGKKDQYE